MTDEQKILIDDFIKKNNKNEDEFNLVLEKLNEFLSPFFNEMIEKSNNKIFFKPSLIGEQFVNSNYDYENPTHILIETFYSNIDDYNYSKTRENKSQMSKFVTDAFNLNKTPLFLENDFINSLYKYFILKGNSIKVFKRKNCIYLKFLDYKFVIFFVSNISNNEDIKFIIKGLSYNFNLKLLHLNLLEKNKQTNENYFNLIKFYKIIENELLLINKLKFEPSRSLYFYENLLYNIPNELLNNNHIYDIFIKSFNYISEAIKNKTIQNFISADNKPLVNNKYKLFAKNYITTFDIVKVLKQCKVFINNIDNIINK